MFLRSGGLVAGCGATEFLRTNIALDNGFLLDRCLRYTEAETNTSTLWCSLLLELVFARD
jgi:hypothetical protein